MKRIIIAAAFAALASPAFAFDVGIVAFQMSSETHARVANAAKDAATAKGWKVQILNSEGSLPKHAQQLDDLIQRKVDAIIVAMGKPVEGDAQLKAAADAKIPVVTVMSGTSHTRCSTSRSTSTRSVRKPRSTCSGCSTIRAIFSPSASTAMLAHASAAACSTRSSPRTRA